MSKRTVKIHTAPDRYKSQLREHNIATAKSPAERMEALGRDSQGRILPRVPKVPENGQS